MGRKTSATRGARKPAKARRSTPDAGEGIQTLDGERNIGIADDAQVEFDCLSARQRIEEYKMRRRLWARVHWLETFDPEPGG